MKILRINKYFYPKGGADIYYLYLNKLLVQEGHEVIPFAMRHEKNEPSEYSRYFVSESDFSKVSFGLKSLKNIGRMMYSFEAARKLDQLIRDTKPDIVHIHNIYHQISPSILPVIKKHKLPIVMTIHDFKLICPTYSMVAKDAICERCKKHKYYQPLFMRCNKNSFFASTLSALEMTFHKLWQVYEHNVDLYITPSLFLKNKFQEFGFYGKKIIHVPHLVDIDAFASASHEAENYFVYFGRLHLTKGVHVLLAALRKLSPDHHVKIIGTGPQEKSLKTLADSLHLTNVEFLGELSGKPLFDVIGRSMAVIVPSVMYETFGQTVAQAMAAKKPVIGTNNGGIAELVEHEKTGLLFSSCDTQALADSIDWIAKHPQEAKVMGEKGYEKVKDVHHAKRHIQKIVEIYSGLLRK